MMTMVTVPMSAGTAAAKDDLSGVVGMAPGASLWALKVCDSGGNCPTSSMIAAIDKVTAEGDKIDVANISITGQNLGSAFSTAISNSVAAGVTYAVAAGNFAMDAARLSPLTMQM